MPLQGTTNPGMQRGTLSELSQDRLVLPDHQRRSAQRKTCLQPGTLLVRCEEALVLGRGPRQLSSMTVQGFDEIPGYRRIRDPWHGAERSILMPKRLLASGAPLAGMRST